MRPGRLDLRLYVILDTAMVGSDLADTARQVIDGGATAIQLRCKSPNLRDFYAGAVLLRQVLQDSAIPLIINDRVDIALAAGADGVHLGTEDLPVADARWLMGTDAVIGASANTRTEAEKAYAEGADYVGVGTVFPTSSKTNIKSVIGIRGLHDIASRLEIPVVAIGGIGREQIADVLDAGASGIAVISAIFSDHSPESGTRGLRQTIDKWSPTHEY